MFFSVIIPTYNRASLVERAVHSILNQVFQDFEILVVDDGSTDNTEEVIRKITDSRLHYFKIQNSERGAARNYGVKQAKGDYVTFLDSDDIVLPNYFQNACESIERYKHPVFLHLGYEIVDNDDNQLMKVDNLKNDDILFLVRGNPLSCTGCFLKTDIAREFRFNEDRNLSGSEDWELWFRVLANHGIKTDNRISARMYNHDERSINKDTQEQKLVKRKELALAYAFKDQGVKKRFDPYFKEIDAFGDSYIALHLALSCNKRRSAHYFLRFVKNYPLAIFSRRFYAIIKRLLMN